MCIRDRLWRRCVATYVCHLKWLPWQPRCCFPCSSTILYIPSCSGIYCRNDNRGCKIFVSSIFRNHYSWIKYLSSNLSYPTRPPDLTGDFSSHPVEVPETLDREMCTLTRADRIAICYHVVLQAKKENPSAQGCDDLYVDLTSKLKRGMLHEKSNLEVPAEMRDYKRRRQSYRAKNVHINRRSHTEPLCSPMANYMLHFHVQEVTPIYLSKWTIIPHKDYSATRHSSKMSSAGRSFRKLRTGNHSASHP
uniref:Uncharacterized protein n=1 Tax=Eptatretus burgeri TaxID=7764 RepID=A0A8C4QJI5_EPTBU